MDEKMRDFTVLLTLLFVTLLVLSACNNISNTDEDDSEQLKYIPDELCFNDQCYQLEHAITEEEKVTGLMYRVHLDQDKGMLFLYDTPSKLVFWMKDTLIPLDILWMDENFTVQNIVNAQPCNELPCELYGDENVSSLYVLEVNGGEAERIGLKVGDTFEMG